MNSEILNWGMNNMDNIDNIDKMADFDETAKMDDNTIICRCSDVTVKEVRDLINEGFTTLEEIKRIARTGMGPCQGRTCGNLIIREINSITGKSIPEIQETVSRPPVVGILMKDIRAGGKEDD